MSITQQNVSQSVIGALAPRIESRGFSFYKGKQYLNLEGDILRNVSVYPNKHNAYVWYGAFPLCEYYLWLGWSPTAGRFPKRHAGLTIRDESELQPGIESLTRGVDKSIRILRRIRDVPAMAKILAEDGQPFRGLAQAYCLASLGDYETAIRCTNEYLDFGPASLQKFEGANLLIEAIDRGTVPELLEQNREDNIKRLRLRRFLQG